LIIVADTGLTSSHALLYQNNNSNNNHWLKVKLQGTINNRDAYGSLVRIVSNGRNWIREIDGGSSHLSHHSAIAHFGLGTYTAVDTIEVIWPDGKSQFLSNIGVDTTILIVEDTAITSYTTQIRNLQSEIDCYPNPFTKHITISYQLNENTHIKLQVYDIMGKKIKSLADEFQSAGDHIIKWDGTNDKGINGRAGFYICRLETAGMVINKKIFFFKA